MIGRQAQPQANTAGNAWHEVDQVNETTQGTRVQEAELQPGIVNGQAQETRRKNAAVISMYTHSQDVGGVAGHSVSSRSSAGLTTA